MKRTAFLILLGLVIASFPACAPLPEDPTQMPAPATPTAPPPTATIVWFPPSETPTPQPLATQGPTPERKPGVGRLLLADKFASAAAWNPGVSEEASVDVGRNRLTIAAQPGVNAFRVRQASALTNFYAELSARPSLCRGNDSYGIVFRALSSAAYYRFAVACNGTARAERVRLGKVTPLHEPVASADAPFGAPGEVRLGVWASGPDMRFFLNGHYQFGITDYSNKAGGVGVFVQSAGNTPVTVIFSDLAVYSVNYSAPTATRTP